MLKVLFLSQREPVHFLNFSIPKDYIFLPQRRAVHHSWKGCNRWEWKVKGWTFYESLRSHQRRASSEDDQDMPTSQVALISNMGLSVLIRLIMRVLMRLLFGEIKLKNQSMSCCMHSHCSHHQSGVRSGHHVRRCTNLESTLCLSGFVHHQQFFFDLIYVSVVVKKINQVWGCG